MEAQEQGNRWKDSPRVHHIAWATFCTQQIYRKQGVGSLFLTLQGHIRPSRLSSRISTKSPPPNPGDERRYILPPVTRLDATIVQTLICYRLDILQLGPCLARCRRSPDCLHGCSQLHCSFCSLDARYVAMNCLDRTVAGSNSIARVPTLLAMDVLNCLCPLV